MKFVSSAYKLNMRGLPHSCFYVRITPGNVDTTAATDGKWISNGELPFSEFGTMGYPCQYGSPHVVLELNRWVLDGRALILPDSGTVRDGFVPSHVSDVEGAFSTLVVITRQFSTPHTFPDLTLTFDTRYQEWPLQITVGFYLSNAPVDTQVAPVAGVEAVANMRAAQVDKVTITSDMALPYRRPRLEEILYGLNKQSVNKDIISTQQKHDVDPLSRRLPTETMGFTIIDYKRNYDPDNSTDTYVYVDKNSLVKIQFGYELPDDSVEWTKSDRYVLSSKPTTKDNQTTFTGTGPIGSLTKTFYKGEFGSRSLFTMAKEILLDVDLTLTEQETHSRKIDRGLKQIFTTVTLSIDTRMNCLQLTAHAARCRLFTGDGNIIHIKPFGMTVTGIYSGQWADNGHLWYSE